MMLRYDATDFFCIVSIPFSPPPPRPSSRSGSRRTLRFSHSPQHCTADNEQLRCRRQACRYRRHLCWWSCRVCWKRENGFWPFYNIIFVYTSSDSLVFSQLRMLSVASLLPSPLCTPVLMSSLPTTIVGLCCLLCLQHFPLPRTGSCFYSPAAFSGDLVAIDVETATLGNVTAEFNVTTVGRGGGGIKY